MRHLTLSILVTLAVLLGGAGDGFALPECPGSPATGSISDVETNPTFIPGKSDLVPGTQSVAVGALIRSWNNCQGTLTIADGTYADGNKYVGEWKEGKEHGQGTFTSALGGKYVGEWKDGNYHGQGTYTTAKGDKYVGEYKYGKAGGKGSKTYANGDKYVGEWKNGEMHGQGTKTYANERVQQGTWVNGKLKLQLNLKPKPWWKFW